MQVDKDDTSEEEPAKHPLENSSSEEASPVREEPPAVPQQPPRPTQHPLENSSSEEDQASPVRDQPPPVSIVINEPQPIVEVTVDSPSESEPNIEVTQPPSPPPEETKIEITPQVVEQEIPDMVKVKDEPIFSSSESEEAIASPPPPPVKSAQPLEDSDEDDLPPPPPPAAADSNRSLKRVDTADSSDDSSEEGPVKALSDSDSSDSSDHVPPEDLQVKQLKKLDTLKESSA